MNSKILKTGDRR